MNHFDVFYVFLMKIVNHLNTFYYIKFLIINKLRIPLNVWENWKKKKSYIILLIFRLINFWKILCLKFKCLEWFKNIRWRFSLRINSQFFIEFYEIYHPLLFLSHSLDQLLNEKNIYSRKISLKDKNFLQRKFKFLIF